MGKRFTISISTMLHAVHDSKVLRTLQGTDVLPGAMHTQLYSLSQKHYISQREDTLA